MTKQAEQGPAFVAGATGYTGNAVVAELRRRGIGTIAHIRPDSSRLDALKERFEALGAEVDQTAWEPEALTATLARHQPSYVFGLLGTTSKRARAERRETGRDVGYEAVDYQLTAMLIRAAESLDLPPRFVFLSSAGVKKSRPGSYLHTRYQVEQLLAASDALSWTVARPAIVSGSDREDSRPLERVAAVAVDGLLALAGMLGAKRTRARWKTIDASELAHVLVEAALAPEATNRIIEPGVWALEHQHSRAGSE